MLIKVLRDYLYEKISGIEFTSSWLNSEPSTLSKAAQMDYDEIDKSDIVLAVFPYGSGTTSEMGYALGKGKKVVYFVDRLFFVGLHNSNSMVKEPLPAGLLYEYFYFDFVENKDKLLEYNGFIVYKMENLIHCLNDLKIFYRKLENED